MNICFLRFHRISKSLLYRPYYDNQRVWQRVSGYQATGTAIQNPFTFYYVQNDDWSNTHSYQFWNKNFTTAVGVNNEETVKTIYSPSPSRYVEPKTAAFTGFTSTGGYTSNGGQFNITGVWNKGWLFYTNGWKSGNTIFFSALGFRDTDSQRPSGTGDIAYANVDGQYWTVGAFSQFYSNYLLFEQGYIYPFTSFARSFGINCSSVKE